MAEKSQWVKIINMVGEPDYAGRIGKITHIDSIKQLHGTWGGCAIQPDKDTFVILTEEEVEAINKAEEERINSYVPPRMDTENEKYTYSCKLIMEVTHLQKLNGMTSKEIDGVIEFEPNGCETISKKYGHVIQAISGVRDSDCGAIRIMINTLLGKTTCYSMNIKPRDCLKNLESVKKAITEFFNSHPEFNK